MAYGVFQQPDSPYSHRNDPDQTTRNKPSRFRSQRAGYQNAPDFDGAEITDSYEDDVRRYFGLETYEEPLQDRVPQEPEEDPEALQTAGDEE